MDGALGPVFVVSELGNAELATVVEATVVFIAGLPKLNAGGADDT